MADREKGIYDHFLIAISGCVLHGLSTNLHFVWKMIYRWNSVNRFNHLQFLTPYFRHTMVIHFVFVIFKAVFHLKIFSMQSEIFFVLCSIKQN